MFFKDVTGQEQVKRQLIESVQHKKVAHALLLCGRQGSGKLPLALAYARYLCCESPNEHDACGVCPSCVKMNKLIHPDIHFAFPIVKQKAGKDSVCNDFLPAWREIILHSPYFGLPDWLEKMGASNQQAQIFVRESDEIQRKLALKASQGQFKVMLIWLPEKMNAECSNKLLKLLEEPPAGTVFLLVSEEPELLLPTIRSRTQRINLPPLSEHEIAQALEERYRIQPDDAREIAHQASGSMLQALEAIHLSEEHKVFLDLFIRLMRSSYARRIVEMKQWSEQVASMGRERQKNFLVYCQRMIRENFIYNFHLPDMNYMTQEEQQFAVRFSPFVNERNVIGIMEELAEAQTHIEQNVNAKIVFFDFALKMIVLLKG